MNSVRCNSEQKGLIQCTSIATANRFCSGAPIIVRLLLFHVKKEGTKPKSLDFQGLSDLVPLSHNFHDDFSDFSVLRHTLHTHKIRSL